MPTPVHGEDADSEAPTQARRGALAWAMAGLLLASCSGAAPGLTALPAGATVLALGDSLTFGTGASPATSYPAVLAATTGWNVVNAGVPGETAAQGCARLPALIDETRPTLLLVLLGGNDLLRRAPAAAIESGLAACVDTARAAKLPLVLLTVPQPALSGQPRPHCSSDSASARACRWSIRDSPRCCGTAPSGRIRCTSTPTATANSRPTFGEGWWAWARSVIEPAPRHLNFLTTVFLIDLIREFGLGLVLLNVFVEQAGMPVPAYPTLIVAGAFLAQDVATSGCPARDRGPRSPAGRHAVVPGGPPLRTRCAADAVQGLAFARFLRGADRVDLRPMGRSFDAFRQVHPGLRVGGDGDGRRGRPALLEIPAVRRARGAALGWASRSRWAGSFATPSATSWKRSRRSAATASDSSRSRWSHGLRRNGCGGSSSSGNCTGWIRISVDDSMRCCSRTCRRRSSTSARR